MLLLAGCGARSELAVSGGAGGGPSTAASTTSASSTSGSSSSSSGSSGGGGSTACTWGFARAIKIDTAGSQLSGVVVDGDHLVIATRDAQHLYAQTLSFDLTTLGPPVELPLTQPSVTMRYAAGFGHRIAVAYDGQSGCQAVALGDDLSPLGPVVQIDDGADLCSPVAATPSGFLVLSTAYIGLTNPEGAAKALLLSTDASPVAAKPVVPAGTEPSDEPRDLGVAIFDDASFVVMSALLIEKTFYAQRFSGAADPLAPPVPVAPLGLTVSSLPLGSSLLLGYDDGLTFGANSVRTAALDASLAVGPVHVVEPVPSSDLVLGLVPGGPGPGSLLVAQQTNVSLTGHWIAPGGSPIGAPFTRDVPFSAHGPVVVGTAEGPVVFWSNPHHPSAWRVLCQ